MQTDLFPNRIDLIFSLEEQTMNNILSGDKRIEFRKVYPNANTRAFVYIKGKRHVSWALDLKSPTQDIEEIRTVGGHGSEDFIAGKKKAK